MRMCPHCKALVPDDNLITCPKCKANLSTYYQNNEVYYDKANVKDEKISGNSNNINKATKNNKNHLKANDSLSQDKTAKVKKLWWLFPAAFLYIMLIVVIIVAVFSYNRSEYTNLNLNYTSNNIATYCDNVFVALPDDNVDRKIKSIEYNENTDEYCIRYKVLPEFFLNKKIDDIFAVEADEKSKEDAFKLGFSGRITEINQDNNDNYVKFVIPDFTQLFDKCSISTLENSNVTDVNFYPAEGYEIEQYIVPMAVSQKADKFSLGGLTAGYTYKKSDKESELDSYEILAKKLKLEIKHKTDTADENEIELTGNVTFDYPAVKFSLDYDNSSGEQKINYYDVGFISKEKANVKIKAKGEVGAEVPEDWIEELSIIDFSDATDEENGKIILGTYVIGYNVPSIILHNNKNNVSYLSLGISVQVAVTLNGEIELEYGIEQSAFLNISDTTDGESTCEIKNYNYPNPVVGEVVFDENKNVDTSTIKTSCKGSIDIKMAIGVDVGFCIFGSIPLKISTDFACVEFVRSLDNESKLKMTPISENGEMKTIDDVSFYQFKSQSNLIINFGAKFEIGIVKYEIGKISMRKMLFSKVWEQFPKPIDFNSTQFDFGNILLGEDYSKKEMNTLFYNDLKNNDKSYLEGKIKDKFIQSTTENISNKINMNFSDLFEFLSLDDQEYDIVCYSEGAIYLTNQETVIAEIIVGDDVENIAHISCGMSRNMVRQIYSEPDDENYINIEFGEIGEELMKTLGMDKLLQFNGTKFTTDVYKSSNSDNEMLMIFDGSDKLILIACN